MLVHKQTFIDVVLLLRRSESLVFFVARQYHLQIVGVVSCVVRLRKELVDLTSYRCDRTSRVIPFKSCSAA